MQWAGSRVRKRAFLLFLKPTNLFCFNCLPNGFSKLLQNYHGQLQLQRHRSQLSLFIPCSKILQSYQQVVLSMNFSRPWCWDQLPRHSQVSHLCRPAPGDGWTQDHVSVEHKHCVDIGIACSFRLDGSYAEMSIKTSSVKLVHKICFIVFESAEWICLMSSGTFGSILCCLWGEFTILLKICRPERVGHVNSVQGVLRAVLQ